MPPKKPAVAAAQSPAAEPPAWEEYGLEAREEVAQDLLRQPWADAGAGPEDLAEGGARVVARVESKGRELTITEGGKTRTVQAGSPTSGVLKEAEPGDTFNRTLYSEGGLTEGYLNDEARLLAMRQSIVMYRDDPMYRAIVDGFVHFIIGKGLKFKARDENPAVQEHLERFWKENKMDGRDAELVRRYLKFGEICLRYFKTGGAAGAQAKLPRVRLVPFWRVAGVTWDQEDPETLVSMQVLPFDPQRGAGAESAAVPADQLQYVANSENEAARGEPPFLVAMRACKWYADFILNRTVLNRYRTSFVLFKKVKGAGPSRVSNVDSATSSATKSGKGGQLEKRLPKAGTVVTHNESIEYEWKNPDTGAMDAEKDGQAIRRYICAAAMVPEFLLGDASQANQDNSLVADNPFVRKVEYYQDFFESVFQEMFRRVLQQGIDTGTLPKMSTETQLAEAGAIRKAAARALRGLGLKEAAAAVEQPKAKTAKVPTKLEVDLEWPTLIQKNALDEIKAMQIEQAMGLASVETLRAKRGYEHDVEEARLENEYSAGQDRFEQERDGELEGEDEDEPASGKSGAPGADKKGPPKGGNFK